MNISEITIIFLLISLLNNGWMIFDGIYALRHKKFFGPDKPGPWATLVKKFGIEPLNMAIPLILLGSTVFMSVFLLFIFQIEFFWYLTIILVLLSLWYIPLGTFLSFTQILLLIAFKTSFLNL